jgi:hypothetical protein
MKETEAFRVMDMSNQPIVTHDDRLLVRAQKSEIRLEAEWREQVEVTYADGRPVILDYWRTGSTGEPERASKEQYEAMEWQEQNTYRPQMLRGLVLAEGVSVSFQNNQMDLRICNLFDDWRSRYRMALEYMVTLTERGVIKYRPTVEAEDDRNRLEAIRNRLKRYGRPTEYEHDILFRGELGQRILADLRGYASHTEGQTTLYIQGYNRGDDTSKVVKFYDIGEREGGALGEYFKLETTMLKEYFKAQKITVSELTEQPVIQERITDGLVKTLTKVVGLLSWEVQSMTAQAIGLEISDRRKAPAQIARAMLSTDRTLTARVGELERKVAALERDMGQVKRATGLK